MTNNKHSEISSFVWSVCDDLLRGLFKGHEYGDVILPFVVLRRLDCVLEPSKDKVIDLYEKYSKKIDDPTPIILNEIGLSFFNQSKYDLQRLRQDHLNISLNFNNYLNGFSQNVREIIENFQLEKPIEKLHKNGKLYQVVETFSSIDFHPNVVDNHTMGLIFEELLRRFSEMSNETSGEHYTPRDEVRLLVSLVFSGSKEDLKGEGKVRSIFDGTCGTGGILTIGKNWILENINPNIEINLYGQELNPQTYSVCKSDLLISGENPNNIRLGSSLSNDQFQGMKFDYQMSNVPFGVSWKSEQEFIENESQNPNGRFGVGTPRSSDGSLLFLQNMISKMDPKGSRIGIIFNSSPLFIGDTGSGESNIRKWIIENDWLECVVQLPDQLFFNTGITTYIWIISNNKKKLRRGKIQLIDSSDNYKLMNKSLGNKRKYITDEMIREITKLYEDFKETENSKIFPNEFFGYTKVVIEQPLVNNCKIERDKNGYPKPDGSLRDTERIPLEIDIDEFFQKEVKPHYPDSWMDRKKDSIGYEINFTKYFYTYKPLRSLEVIRKELLDIEKETDGLINNLLDLKEQKTSIINKVMTKGLDPNVKMKNSGLEWIGEIPEHWGRYELRYILDLLTDFESNGSFSSVKENVKVDDEGEVWYVRMTDLENNNIRNENCKYCDIDTYNFLHKTKLFGGELLITKRGEIGKVYLFPHNCGLSTLGPNSYLLRLKEGKVSSKYLYYFYKSDCGQITLRLLNNSTTIGSLYKDDIKGSIVVLPPISEQLQIVEHLENQTREIDDLILLEQRKNELLKEYRQSLISNIITGKTEVPKN